MGLARPVNRESMAVDMCIRRIAKSVMTCTNIGDV